MMAISVVTFPETLERKPAFSAEKYQRESRARKPHDAVVKFDAYRNLQRHRTVLPAQHGFLVANHGANT